MPPQLGGFLVRHHFLRQLLAAPAQRSLHRRGARPPRDGRHGEQRLSQLGPATTGRNRDAVADYAVACWKAICAKREENEA